MKRVVVQIDYPEEIENKLLSIITTAISLPGVKYQIPPKSFEVPAGSTAVKITEVHGKLDSDAAFARQTRI